MEFLQNISPRDYQRKIYQTCIEKNCLVVLPTGLGKTLIALMITIDRMKKFPGQKVVFLAPTRPLAEQHLVSYKKYLPELFADIQLFTGKVDAKDRKKIWQTADIIFSTPQCVANDLRKGLYDLKDVCLLIEDEAHRCLKNYDYNFIAKRYKSEGENKRIVGLTASPGSDSAKIKQICENLSIEEVELRTRDSPDVKPYLQELTFEKVSVDLPPEFEEMRQVLKNLFDKYIEELKTRNVLYGPVSKIALLELQKKISASIGRGNQNYSYMLAASACAQAIKLQHALELLETQTLYSFNQYLKDLLEQASKQKSKGVVKLVSNPQFNYVFSQSTELLAKKREHPKLDKLIEIVKSQENPKIIVFTQFRDTASNISKKLNEIDGIKSKVFVGQAKKSRADSSTGLSQKEQKKIIQEFSCGEINVLCATSIAEEGLDIPEVSLVVFYESVPSAIRKIQRAGRTARLAQGKLIMLITRNTRDETFYYVSRSREKKMHSAISEVKDHLANKTKTDKQTTLK